jgi:hypothetical protein
MKNKSKPEILKILGHNGRRGKVETKRGEMKSIDQFENSERTQKIHAAME